MVVCRRQDWYVDSPVGESTRRTSPSRCPGAVVVGAAVVGAGSAHDSAMVGEQGERRAPSRRRKRLVRRTEGLSIVVVLLVGMRPRSENLRIVDHREAPRQGAGSASHELRRLIRAVLPHWPSVLGDAMGRSGYLAGVQTEWSSPATAGRCDASPYDLGGVGGKRDRFCRSAGGGTSLRTGITVVWMARPAHVRRVGAGEGLGRARRRGPSGRPGWASTSSMPSGSASSSTRSGTTTGSSSAATPCVTSSRSTTSLSGVRQALPAGLHGAPVPRGLPRLGAQGSTCPSRPTSPTRKH